MLMGMRQLNSKLPASSKGPVLQLWLQTRDKGREPRSGRSARDKMQLQKRKAPEGNGAVFWASSIPEDPFFYLMPRSSMKTFPL